MTAISFLRVSVQHLTKPSMNGLIELNSLPEEVQKCLVARYGSLVELYKRIFTLHSEDYRNMKDDQRVAIIRKHLDDIIDALEDCGVADGQDVVSSVASDFGELIVAKTVKDLNDYLKPLGTNFEEMRRWLKDTYGI